MLTRLADSQQVGRRQIAGTAHSRPTLCGTVGHNDGVFVAGLAIGFDRLAGNGW